MSEPIKVEPARLFEFISRPGLVVLFVPLHGAHPFNQALPRHLRSGDVDVEFGRVSLVELFLAGGSALAILQQGLRACGVSKAFDILPGYYLFERGQMIAWESGFPTTADLQTIVGASLLGVVGYAVTRDVAVVTKALRLGTLEGAAARLATSFRKAAAEHRAAPRPPPPPPPPPPISELLNAYRLLGVDPRASDREVNAAWRRRQADLHPDRAAGDPKEFERRSRLSTNLNRARDIIRNHRARTRAHGHDAWSAA